MDYIWKEKKTKNEWEKNSGENRKKKKDDYKTSDS